QIISAQQIERWPAGKILFKQGDDPQGIFIVHSGQVDLVFSARSGVTKALCSVRPGNIVGLSDAISGTKYECTATTRTASRIGFVPLVELRRMLDENPGLWLGIATSLSADLGSCWACMRSLGALR
ncbi:MAG TPA: cyclic nucleotide-binding domain-containing protein, partial [Thermoanaerobaculia bacterium]